MTNRGPVAQHGRASVETSKLKEIKSFLIIKHNSSKIKSNRLFVLDEAFNRYERDQVVAGSNILINPSNFIENPVRPFY